MILLVAYASRVCRIFRARLYNEIYNAMTRWLDDKKQYCAELVVVFICNCNCCWLDKKVHYIQSSGQQRKSNIERWAFKRPMRALL